MIFKLNGVLEVVKVHVRAIYHQADCSGSWVIILSSFCPISQW